MSVKLTGLIHCSFVYEVKMTAASQIQFANAKRLTVFFLDTMYINNCLHKTLIYFILFKVFNVFTRFLF